MDSLRKKALTKGKPPIAVPKNYESDDDEEEAKDVFDAEAKMPPVGMMIESASGGNFGSGGLGMAPPLPKSKPHLNYSPLKWEDFYDKMDYMEDGTPIYVAGGEMGPVFVCLHGAGHSAQSFACVAGEIKKYATVVAFDFRGHGLSRVETDPHNYSVATLVNDTINILIAVEKLFPTLTIIVMGHSMGGAIAIKATEAAVNIDALKPKIHGLIVIDVVEGTAIEALPYMEAIVKNRPGAFKDYESAIQWAYRSNTVKDVTSARVSIPPQLVEFEEKDKKIKELVWKVDLMASQAYWMEWFTGLTASFLGIRVPKLLLLAGAERMDKELTIAHMQGKFKLKVIYDVGHSVQEDNWKETGKVCYDFLYSFRVPINMEEVEYIQTNGVGTFHPKLAANPYS